MSQYQASVPDGELIQPEIQHFFESFYKISDTPDAHEKYSEQFTKHAKLVIGLNEASGRENILKMRKGMWEKVASRSHKPMKLYSFGHEAHECMLFGTVDYELKDGKKANVEWSARSHFTHEDGQLRMDFYQVYLDSAAMARAK